eukprot:TRINITY_DN8845_c0_g1_i7.p2 TRINITY_DN8845_c0_g1~~TRINITY_DN8845_c0_g1_i7.p2  ORF type:complete len:113 (-),score=21.02 TRINITY_DN8845_c0_g1_i7:263-601(-)
MNLSLLKQPEEISLEGSQSSETEPARQAIEKLQRDKAELATRCATLERELVQQLESIEAVRDELGGRSGEGVVQRTRRREQSVECAGNGAGEGGVGKAFGVHDAVLHRAGED